MPRSRELEAREHTRFVVARAFVARELGVYDYGRAARELGISIRTLKRDIARAHCNQTFEEWRPGRRGPKPGVRRAIPQVMQVVELHTYASASGKRNLAKLSRDLEHHLQIEGVSAVDVPSQSTLERIIKDIEASDPAHFAERRYARAGRHSHSLQHGSLEAEHPLHIVCIDHTPLDLRTYQLGDMKLVFRPTFTQAIDVFTTTCLAAFVSPFPPSGTTVALAMALSSGSKTDLLQAYGIPGEWEAGGLGRILYVDGGSELTSDAVVAGCKRFGIELRIAWPGRPDRRGLSERVFRTFNSDIHSWEGTTLSNTVELAAHGGQQPPAWNFEEVQRRILIAAMEYNNETYGQGKIPPIMQWRDQIHRADARSRVPYDPVRTFIDFLPFKERDLTFGGVRFEKCFYRSGDIAKLIYEGVKKVVIRYDPRDVGHLWITTSDGYLKIPRAYPKTAPRDLYALRRWNRDKAAAAEAKKDSALLRKLVEARNRQWGTFASYLEDGDGRSSNQQPITPTPSDLPSSQPADELTLAETIDNIRRRLSGDAPITDRSPAGAMESASNPTVAPEPPTTADRLAPDFTIPAFKPRLK